MWKDKIWKAIAIGVVILTIIASIIGCVNSCKNFTQVTQSFSSESEEYDEIKEKQKNTLIERFGTTNKKVYVFDKATSCFLKIVQISLIDLLFFKIFLQNRSFVTTERIYLIYGFAKAFGQYLYVAL